MNYLVRLFGRTSKIVKTVAHVSHVNISNARLVQQKCWNRSTVSRFLPQFNFHDGDDGSRAGSRATNESSNYSPKFLLAGGTLLTLLNWGEEEEKEEIPELIMSIKRSIYLIQKEEFQKAEQMLHVALRQAQSIQHYQGITYIYDVMANLAFEVGDYKKAEKLFISVMQRLISTGTPKDDIQIIHISLKMAKLFQEMGDLGKAEDGYEFCLEKLEDHMKRDADNEDIIVLWGMSLDWYARMLLTQSKFKKALSYFEQAYHLCLRVNGREHEQTVVLLNDIGTLCCLCGEHDRAINYLTIAAEIGEKLPGMIDLGSIYVNLGSTYLEKKMYDEARKECQRGLDIAKTRKDEECVLEANDCLRTIEKLFNT